MAAPLQIGRYVLHGQIASGGMASVHFGRLVGTGGFNKTVAIKRLHRSLARTESFRRMILEEGRLAARVRHPNVVPPLDVLAEGGELLLVMEYVHGESLSKLLRAASKNGEPVPLAVGAAILSNVLHGLHAAHEARDESGMPLGIVHRDVSPQNVIVGADGVARVIDFGIAKAVTSEEMTSVGTVKGKVPYLAPEQLDGEPATRRTDVYAAAVVFWEVLAGRRLFEGNDDAAVLRQILTMPVGPPSAFNPLVPPLVDHLVLRALSRDPRERFGSAREMALELEGAIHLATSTIVGAWTERLAAKTLAERAARIAELEAASGTREEDTLSAPSARASSTLVRPPPATRQTFEPRTVIYEPPPMPEPAFIEGVRALPRSPSPPPPPPPVSSALPPPEVLRPPPAGALRKPELEIANVAWLPTPSPKPVQSSALLRFVRYLAVFVVLMAIVAYMFAPALARAWITTGAASRGIVVTIERVDVTRKAVRLSDVHAAVAELPGASARLGTVSIGLHWLVPESITVEDAELTLEGPYGELGERLEAFRVRHPRMLEEALAGIQKIELMSGRVEWKEPVGAGTSALVENITLDVTKVGMRALGDDYHLSAPLFKMRIADASAGPWQLDLDRQGILARSVVHFDPLGSYPASVTRTAADDGSVSLSFSVPPTSLADLHLPPAVLGGLATGRTRLEAHGEVSLVTVLQAGAGAGGAPAPTTSRAASGHLVFAAGSLAIFPAGPLVDLSLDLPLSGDAARAIPVAGTLAVASADPTGGASTATASAALSGTFDLSGRVARLALRGKTGAIPCAGPGGAGASTGLGASVVASLDDYPGAKVSFVPVSNCQPRLR